jgi:hypothetical protein
MHSGDGTVTDNLTGLMWAKDAYHGSMIWNDAIDYANNLSLGSAGRAASYTDWRLPNVKELLSLIDFSNYNPALPTGHLFSNVQSGYYWSSTTCTSSTGYAWLVNVGYSYVASNDKTTSGYVWPVRSGN